MKMRQLLLIFIAMLSYTLFSKEIVIGPELVPKKTMAFLVTPVVIPDLISAKIGIEYRLHDKFNLIIPVEAKWMDYRRAIKFFGENAGQENLPEAWYKPDAQIKPLWNFNIYQLKISSGVGVKWFPFSESMTNAFFVKGMFLAGYERLNAYGVDGKKEGAIFTEVASIGYNWVKKNRFTFGFELGQEYSWHTNPIKKMPIVVDGFLPFMQFSLGFTI